MRTKLKNFLFSCFLHAILCELWITASAYSTLCYICHDTKAGGPCQTNLKDMADTAADYLNNGTSVQSGVNKFVKHCSPASQPYCVIEVLETKGMVPSFIRDCSDGVIIPYDLPKLEEVRPDNQTTCAYYTQGYVSCVRLCSGDFCNGPKPTSISNVPKLSDIAFALMILSVILQNM